MDDQTLSRNAQRAFNRSAGKAIFPALLIALTAFGVLAFDTTWVGTGKPISAASLQANLTEIQGRLTALEAKSPNYIALAMSTSACSVSNGFTVSFDLITASRGITAANGAVNLKGGHTYRLESILNTAGPTSSRYLGYSLYLSGLGSISTAYTGDNAAYQFHAGLLSIFTPSVDTSASVTVVDANMGSGCITNNYDTYFIATELN